MKINIFKKKKKKKKKKKNRETIEMHEVVVVFWVVFSSRT